MTTTLFHPATVRLLGLQSHGRLRRIWRRFCQPRRLILSAVACVLGIVWLGNAALTVWLRETASPPTLRALLSLGLALYAGWHVAKCAFFRPENPFDWTPTDREILAGMPLRPRDLVAYQLASVTVTTLLKAGLFTVLLLPDLHCVPLGFLGVVQAMIALEMLRMAIEIATWGMSRPVFLTYRAMVVAGLTAAGIAVGTTLVRADAFGGRLNVGEGRGLLARFLDIMVQLNDSVVGDLALPFRPFVELILADNLHAINMILATATTAAVIGLSLGVIGLYAATCRRMATRERRDYHPGSATHEVSSSSTINDIGPAPAPRDAFRFRRPSIPRWGGAGALAWRQLLGARRHWGSLLTAMIAPAVIASAPSFVIADPQIAFLVTTGTLAFYTFLLLPTALRFDFRRDVDRLAILKGLPIRPAAAVIGQTLAPVLMATLFQGAVLAFALALRSLPPHHLFTAMLVMIPLDVLVFGLDNLIFLLYPYRMQQEGLEIFLRTILTFTGKGLVFAAGMALVSAWGLAAAALAHAVSHWTGFAVNARVLFAGGTIAGASLLAASILYGLCRVYRKMNPIEDLPR